MIFFGDASSARGSLYESTVRLEENGHSVEVTMNWEMNIKTCK